MNFFNDFGVHSSLFFNSSSIYFVFIFQIRFFATFWLDFLQFFCIFLYPCQLFVWRSKQYKANWRKHAYAHCICGDNTHELTRKLYVYKSCSAWDCGVNKSLVPGFFNISYSLSDPTKFSKSRHKIGHTFGKQSILRITITDWQ